MLSQILDLKPAEFIWTGGDCHIYKNHFIQAKEQIKRKPQPPPTLLMPKVTKIEDITNSTPKDYKLLNYSPMDSIKAPMAV